MIIHDEQVSSGQGVCVCVCVCACPDLVVDGDAVGPVDVGVGENHPLGTVQTRTLNTRVQTPFCPEQVPAHTHTHTHTEMTSKYYKQKLWLWNKYYLKYSQILWVPLISYEGMGVRTDPFSGWTVMARGLSRPWEITT